MRIRLIFPEFQFLLSRIIAQTVFRFGGRYAIAFQFFLSCIISNLTAYLGDGMKINFQFFLSCIGGNEHLGQGAERPGKLSILSELHQYK